jgi:hypothetical protein
MAIRTALPMSADDAALRDLEEIDETLNVRLGLGILDQFGLGFFQQQSGFVERAVGTLQEVIESAVKPRRFRPSTLMP